MVEKFMNEMSTDDRIILENYAAGVNKMVE